MSNGRTNPPAGADTKPAVSTAAKPAKEPAKKNVYRLKDKQEKDRLVNAVSPHAAIIHVYKPECHLAKVAEASQLLKAGVEIEEA
jgi:hypothetical protein